jgi:two-component system, cell cycle response regulator DivK
MLLLGGSVTSKEPVQPRDTVNASILVVEDNPDSRDALRALLEAYGFQVLEAEDGELGLETAVRSRPDLILMDIMMPVMDGLEATRKLRSDEQFDRIPIIALTAMAGSQEPAMRAGCDDYLSKPIDIPRFLGTIRRWLASGRAASCG